MEENAPDEKTLALLVAISDLTEQKHSVSHIVNVYKRSVEQARERLKDGDQPYTYTGF